MNVSIGGDWRHAVVVAVGSLIAIVLITATVFLCLRYHRQKQGASPGLYCQQELLHQMLLPYTVLQTSYGIFVTVI